MKQRNYQLILLLLIAGLTRLPFIFDGYGVEEDSWGLVVNSYEMHQSGHYVASRFPGHPVQEYAYALMYNAPAWAYNLLSLAAGMMAVAFFFLALKKMQLNAAFVTALSFCFVPVFYISGTYTIDYSFSIAFVMASLYFLLGRKLALSGIMLGLATGCRITSEVFLLPWVILLYNSLDRKTWIRQSFLLAVPAVLVAILLFIPVYLQYGRAFFDYSDQFPYPPFAKVAYKASIGVFGFLGIAAIVLFFVPAFRSWRKKQFQPVTLFSSERLLLACLVVVALQIASYLRLPQKSGYVMPIAPFVILLFAVLLSEKQMRRMTILFVLAPFLMSINLTDALRGSESSSLALKFKMAGQEIFIDPVSGPVFSERSKRINKMNYCDSVVKIADRLDTRFMVISGWWYNELQTHYLKKDNRPNPHFYFYADQPTLDSAKAAGAEIFYLPEQDLYNDQMFGQDCTNQYAKPFPGK